MALEMKKIFLEEGIFTIRVTMLGPNLCVLEDLVFGEVEIFIEERRKWWEQWFKDIRPWKTTDTDKDRFSWIRVAGIPCHAWRLKLFRTLAERYGGFVKCDDKSISRVSMDEARILIQTSHQSLINEVVKMVVGGDSFSLLIMEDSHTQIELAKTRTEREDEEDSVSSSFQDGRSSDEAMGEDEGVGPNRKVSGEVVALNDVLGEAESKREAAAVDSEEQEKHFVSSKEKTLESYTNQGVPVAPDIPSFSRALNEAPMHALNAKTAGSGDICKRRNGKEECGEVSRSSGVGGTEASGDFSGSNSTFSGLENVIGLSSRPLSFDSECRNMILSKPNLKTAKIKGRKYRNVTDLGEKVDMVPSYFDCIAPRRADSSKDLFNGGNKLESADEEGMKGTSALCPSPSDSEVIRCNDRAGRNSLSNVGGNLWKSIKRLGVSSGVDDVTNEEALKVMEKRDRLGLKGKKESTKSFI
ncbi:uncharacterized protein LOC131651429 [Vicia villosa]|uniref:uncharacterized protein LOC131651429 n=1 Tax=Vicia villosa TaxID=3911 RepID=UPI00273C5905|nr:uncharacterized protein LOC131651429 [Vicia villosa]